MCRMICKNDECGSPNVKEGWCLDCGEQYQGVTDQQRIAELEAELAKEKFIGKYVLEKIKGSCHDDAWWYESLFEKAEDELATAKAKEQS